jgi:hypothetical protein
LACRHHIGEIIIKQVWDDLKIEKANSDNVAILKKLKTNFFKLVNLDDRSIRCFNIFQGSPIPLQQIDQLKGFYKDCLVKKKPRNDYQELVQLCLAYLGEKCDNFNFQRPGAIHRARWMAKIIYSFKIVFIISKLIYRQKFVVKLMAKVTCQSFYLR